VIRLYAITDRPAASRRPLPTEPGVDGHGLAEVVRGRLAAVIGRDAAEVAPSTDALWAHEAVADALMAERALLPLRFGTLLADEAAVERVLEERRGEFARALLRVRGRVELGVRAAVASPAEPPGGEERAVVLARGAPGAGHAYLAEQRARRDRAEALLDAIHAPLARLADASERRVGGATHPTLRAAYLVPAPGVDTFRAAVDGLARERPDVAVACTGPWPPYSFVGDRDPESA
jgi:gas vesicle protein GvpL/GvpF